MTELSDYKRLVEAPMRRDYELRIRELGDQLRKAESERAAERTARARMEEALEQIQSRGGAHPDRRPKCDAYTAEYWHGADAAYNDVGEIAHRALQGVQDER